jgi:hypothetical protein
MMKYLVDKKLKTFLILEITVNLIWIYKIKRNHKFVIGKYNRLSRINKLI